MRIFLGTLAAIVAAIALFFVGSLIWHDANYPGYTYRYRLSISPEIDGQVRGGRWHVIGDQSVHLHNGDVSDRGEMWAAVFQGGPRACLDGGSALITAGLER